MRLTSRNGWENLTKNWKSGSDLSEMNAEAHQLEGQVVVELKALTALEDVAENVAMILEDIV